MASLPRGWQLGRGAPLALLPRELVAHALAFHPAALPVLAQTGARWRQWARGQARLWECVFWATLHLGRLYMLPPLLRESLSLVLAVNNSRGCERWQCVLVMPLDEYQRIVHDAIRHDRVTRSLCAVTKHQFCHLANVPPVGWRLHDRVTRGLCAVTKHQFCHLANVLPVGWRLHHSRDGKNYCIWVRTWRATAQLISESDSVFSIMRKLGFTLLHDRTACVTHNGSAA